MPSGRRPSHSSVGRPRHPRARRPLGRLLLLTLFAAFLPGAPPAAAAPFDHDGLSARQEQRLGTNPHRADTDRDGLRDGYEVRRSRTNPLRRDSDRDRLRDGYEVKRSHTSPRRKDTDGDGLSDWYEVRRSRTNPLRRDTDGDGVMDPLELLLGLDPLRPGGPGVPVPALPAILGPGTSPSPPDTTPPNTTIGAGPTGTVATGAATFAFSSTEGGSTFECRVDGGGWTGCSSPKAYGALGNGSHTFEVRARDAANNVDPSPASRTWAVDVSAPPPPLPTFAQPSCEPGATNVSTAAAIRSELDAGHNVCVTAVAGDANLDGLTSATMRFVGTSATGSIGAIHLDGASRITFRARFRSIVITGSNVITIEQSVIGGTPANRTLDQLIFIPAQSDDVTIRDNDIGWSTADNTGNAGYGIRAYHGDRLRIERNYLHHLGGDGMQLGMDGADTLVDRNEIAYVSAPNTSTEHSDDLQVTGNGPNTRITNNYLHHNGWIDANTESSKGSGPYIHAGDNGALLFENNLIRDEHNFMQVGDLGTGGCSKSNLTFRRNTFIHNGTQFSSAADMEWSLCAGTGNLFERNVVNDTLWVKYGFVQSGTTARDNLEGAQYTIDPATGDCTVAACNPAGQEPIGYRKPSGAHW